MQRGAWIWVAGVVTLVVLYGCGNSASQPKPGDTITPLLGQKLTWTAGSPVELAVRLQAEDKNGDKRPLEFRGIDKDPIAKVVFFEGDASLGSQQVTLSHRC